MSEPAAQYKVEAGPRTEKPCPFCGGTDLVSNEWVVDEEHAERLGADEFEEVWAWECRNCLGSAPIVSWEQRATPDRIVLGGWVFPLGDRDMPAAGQRVYALFEGSTSPVTATPVHSDGSHIVDGASIYMPLVCWCPLPELPDDAGESDG